MPTVDFIYDRDCPNAGQARENLRLAFERIGMTAAWSEHRIGDASAPPHTRGFGSPTILIDGLDIAGGSAGAEASCRIYRGPDGASGAPCVDAIIEALRRAG